jgi:hypothetical protein
MTPHARLALGLRAYGPADRVPELPLIPDEVLEFAHDRDGTTQCS